jgi:hypothetical protein
MIEKYVGQNVFVRTVTHHYTGKLVAADEKWLRLEDAAWIADDGRFADCLQGGKPVEVEPYPGEALVAIGAVIDVSVWSHPLPREQK